MTGKAEGKLELKKAKVFLLANDKKILIKNVIVYIHLKGYAQARVTHLDVEHDFLNKIIPPKEGEFLSIYGVEKGIKIKLEKEKKIEYLHKEATLSSIGVFHGYLAEVLRQNERTRTWVGGKIGGIYIGFRKEQIEKLENIARKKFKP